MKPDTSKRYVLAQDIVIPAGTPLGPSPNRIVHFVPHTMAVIAHGKDHCSRWNIDLEEALSIGIVTCDEKEGVSA